MSENKKSFTDVLKEAESPVLVDIFSDTCGPCIALKPVLTDLKNNLGDGIKIIKINGPKNMAFMEEWQIQAFPTLMLFNKGELVWREMGFRPLAQLQKMVTDAVPA